MVTFQKYIGGKRWQWFVFSVKPLCTTVIFFLHLLFQDAEFFFFFFFFFGLLRAIPTAYGGSQARGLNRSCSWWPTPQPQQRGIQAASATYTAAHGKARSFTHWARPGIELASLRLLVRFVNHWATMGTPDAGILFMDVPECF